MAKSYINCNTCPAKRTKVEVSRFTEELIYAGFSFVAMAAIIYQIISLTDHYSMSYISAVVALYTIGILGVFVCGIWALTQLSETYQFVWYLFLFIGSQLSLMSPVIGGFIDPTFRILYYTVVAFGGALSCISIATIQMFRQVQYRVLAKGSIITGIILCHTVSIVAIHGYIWIPFDIGMVLIAIGYIPARYMTIKKTQEKHVAIPIEEENPILNYSEA